MNTETVPRSASDPESVVTGYFPEKNGNPEDSAAIRTAVGADNSRISDSELQLIIDAWPNLQPEVKAHLVAVVRRGHSKPGYEAE